MSSDLPLLRRLQLLYLRRVLGPWRRRFWSVDVHLPRPLSADEVLARLVAMPVSTWSYEFEPGVRHMGPMAQDFAASFGLGRTARMIEPQDANGVNVVALQALHRRLEALERAVARVTADDVVAQHPARLDPPTGST